ncbi:hypothetical protein E4L96_23195 [Massilia arenosa]|uniref:DUF2189 domain-containing protein n=1 Tax=Zemynaea arenosa TaxID=2561931 RepID=A0A4Y9RSU6_9BURK|nr:BPSS1780 family membrane protein [Massilia arenosa]TFW10619.1 hypothetical protein E4L96_23195 [Massilia arenosa]
MTDSPISSLPAGTGWQWFKQGVALFRRQPGALTTILFINLMASSIVSSLPIIGPIVVLMFVPSMAMAIMQACALIDQNRRVDLRVLGTGFRKPALPRLVGVGLVYLLVSLAMASLAFMMSDHEAMRKVLEQVRSNSPQQVDTSALTPLVGMSFANMAILTALAFAAPLTAWQQMGVGKAVFYSVFATLRAFKVFLVLLLGWLVTMIVSVQLVVFVFSLLSPFAGLVIGMWLGTIFLLLLQCALYAGYRQVFGVPQLG